MSEWATVRLADVAVVDMGQSPPGSTYNTQGAGLPFLQGSAEFGARYPSPVKWCSQPAKIAEPGDLMVSVRAPVGDSNFANQRIAIGRGLAVIRAGAGSSNEFLRLVVQHSTTELLAHSGTGMFSSITGRELKGFEIALPSPDEQRLIVAVMAAMDAQIEAVEREVAAAGSVLKAVLTASMDDLTARVSYGSLATTRSGPSWSASEEFKTPVDGATRVVKITNTKGDGTLDMSDETYVIRLPGSTATLDASSLIIVRTNGNRDRIGNVYRATPEVYRCAVSAFQFISRAGISPDRDFLYWALREPSMQQRMSDAASGSTGLGNLAVRWLNAVEIPWTDDGQERRAIVATLDATEFAFSALEAELRSLRTVRAGLLTALLSQEITIDAAVDQFVKAA